MSNSCAVTKSYTQIHQQFTKSYYKKGAAMCHQSEYPGGIFRTAT